MVASTRDKQFTLNEDDIHESLLKLQNFDFDPVKDRDDSRYAGGGETAALVASKFKAAVNSIKDYKKGEAETIRRVLDEIDMVSVKRMSEGFNEFNFSMGVFNCLFITYMFGAHPEHLWLIYLVQGLYMIPRKFYNMWNAKPLNQALYYLDFCWCMNFTGIFVIGLLAILGLVHGDDRVSNVARESFYNALLGVACGTLMGANIALPFVACLFHDVNTMTGLFIHLMPPMVMYTFIWHSDAVRSAWPGIFHLTYMDEIHYFPKSGPIFAPGSGLDSVVGNSVVLYLLWWIPYVCFMLLIGIDLPKKLKYDGTPNNPKWDTVFHSTMRQGVCISIGRMLRGRSKRDSLKQMEENDFDLIDFFIYMTFHMIASVIAFYLIGYPCFKSQNFHLFMLVFVAW
eukprot:CAMPEP_0181087492 /NCGR_PEP_ID=MMETSP1071-20121207/6299_1 /TAXON_ID=35127 /ORGANISM="Thalassiosira sp., Strain NH16" /LENGTH=397 /DNA_ID=CAMNT_0023169379 /DNA_START=172 /DNA_END=1362 /DNA_ORIENTATION=+